MPGVNVTTTTRTGPVGQSVAPSGQVFMAGLAERGITTAPVLIGGMADYEAAFGSRVSYSHLYDNLATFFEEGGARAYVARTVGPAATVGTYMMVDRAGAPLSTIRMDAAGAGAWSSNLSIVVTTVGSNCQIQVLLSGTVVQTVAAATVDELVSGFAGSNYVVATNMGSATSAPNNLPALGTFAVSAGSDDRASVTATHYEDSLDLFGIALGDGAVAIPGIGSTVHAVLLSHASANRRIALLSMAETTAEATLKSTAEALNSQYGGLFAPWVEINTVTGTRFTSPEGFVAAMRNRAHSESGPWRAPAGQIGVARYVTGLKYDYSRTQGDSLDASKVSAIRLINNTVRLYGWRSLSDDAANYSLLTGRDVLNRVVTAAEEVLEQFVFQSIDGKGQLLSAVNGSLVGILEPMRQGGGLYERFDAAGNFVDPGYLVETGSTVNTLTNLANNIVNARVSVRVSPSAALISVTIVKVGLLSGL